MATNSRKSISLSVDDWIALGEALTYYSSSAGGYSDQEYNAPPEVRDALLVARKVLDRIESLLDLA